MSLVLTGADALRFVIPGSPPQVEIVSLEAVGTLAGLVIDQVGARNGPGLGLLSTDGNGLVRWRAPGSSTPGPAVDVSAGGAFLLLDGDDPDKWVRITAYAAYLPTEPRSDEVVLIDQYNNQVAGTDVTAAEAAAGNVESSSILIRNDSATGVLNLRGWLDAETIADDFLELSFDLATWVQPDSDTHPDAPIASVLQSGAFQTFQWRRTIGAGQASDPEVLNHIHLAWDGQ